MTDHFVVSLEVRCINCSGFATVYMEEIERKARVYFTEQFEELDIDVDLVFTCPLCQQKGVVSI